ncbi:MAG: DUF4446 family protein [Jatrophihabitantaceae bacterium]
MSTYVGVFAMVLAYLALVAAYFALRTLAKLRRATALLSRGTHATGTDSLVEATQRHAELTTAVSEQLVALRGYVDQTREQALTASQLHGSQDAGGLRTVALVRYDAFGAMSGRMSFSLALLDENGDGVALSAIAGQSDTRVYAKGITAGKGEHELSPEEQQAVSSAMQPRAQARKAS